MVMMKEIRVEAMRLGFSNTFIYIPIVQACIRNPWFVVFLHPRPEPLRSYVVGHMAKSKTIPFCCGCSPEVSKQAGSPIVTLGSAVARIKGI